MPFWVFPAVIATLAAAGVAKAKAKANPKYPTSTAGGKGNPYTVESWRPYLEPMCRGASIPVNLALQWMRVESGGNPCAFGSAAAHGPDGNPREIGLAQLYNPDDFERLGLSQTALRAYCVPGTQVCKRYLTEPEKLYAVAGLVKLITDCHNRAVAQLRAAGARWNQQDEWKLAKLVHALPGLVRGVGLFTAKYKRPAASWADYRDLASTLKFDKETERYRYMFAKLFRNADETGRVVPTGDGSV